MRSSGAAAHVSGSLDLLCSEEIGRTAGRASPWAQCSALRAPGSTENARAWAPPARKADAARHRLRTPEQLSRVEEIAAHAALDEGGRLARGRLVLLSTQDPLALLRPIWFLLATMVGTRVDAVGDAGRDDGQDGRSPLTAEVVPREEPVAPPEDELSQFTFNSIVRELDVPVAEKEHETLPLAMEVAERGAERRLWWHCRSLLLEPDAESFHHGRALLRPSGEPLRRVVAVDRALPFHGEERPDHAQRREPDLVAGPGRLDEAATRVTPA